MKALKDSIRRISFFRHFPETTLEEVVRLGESVALNAGETLFKQGDPAESLYVILSGTVAVFGRDPQGQELELSVLEPGDFFGELALVDGGTRSATIRAAQNCELFQLGRQGFLSALTRSPELLSELLADISSKISSANEKIFNEMLARQKVHAEMEIERHRSLSQMVAGVAHEINTPLGIVNVSASMINEYLTPELLERATDPELRSALDDIVEAASLMQNNIARANRLINTFKSVSVNQITDTLEHTDLLAQVRENVDLYAIKARQAGIGLAVLPETGLETAPWHGYPGYLSQIVLNLLSNIERYAYPHHRGGQVDIRLSRENSQSYRLEIQDYGQGMQAEDAAQIFDVFFTTGRDKGGTGLGMAIVHNLVTSALQGQISVQSTPGEGTCVTLLLPQDVPAAQAAAEGVN
ncbi:MAG: sensor histidine kinase [Candidatus Sericytochromatia bacterium]